MRCQLSLVHDDLSLRLSFRQYFSKYGTLADIALMKDKYTGHPRGFGFIKFEDLTGRTRCSHICPSWCNPDGSCLVFQPIYVSPSSNDTDMSGVPRRASMCRYSRPHHFPEGVHADVHKFSLRTVTLSLLVPHSPSRSDLRSRQFWTRCCLRSIRLMAK